MDNVRGEWQSEGSGPSVVIEIFDTRYSTVISDLLKNSVINLFFLFSFFFSVFIFFFPN